MSKPVGADEMLDRIEELEAANDAAEKDHNISSEGGLWRFWSNKARDMATKNVVLKKRINELEAKLKTARADALKEAIMANAETLTPRYPVGETVSYTDRHGREQTGRVKYIEGKWREGYTTLTYTVEHPTYHNGRAHIGAAAIAKAKETE